MVAMSTRAGAAQILSADELTAMAVLQSLQQEPGSQSGLAHASFADEHQVLVFSDEVEFGKGAYLFTIYSGLARPGKRF
jgi:hypothetical protein